MKWLGLTYEFWLSFKKLRTAIVSLFITAILAGVWPAAEKATQFDIIIRGAKVLDGSGRPPYSADIGIRAGVIARIGNLSSMTAKRTINAGGMHATPGFIDMHSHVDDAFEKPEGRIALNNLMQGITTVVVGQDGNSAWSRNETIVDASSRWSHWGLASNAILLVGHGSVRRAVMGNVDRSPTNQELDRMKEMVRQAMQGGAYGLSSGLDNVPGKFAQTDEIIALTHELKPYGGFYISHVRDEADRLNQSIEEIIRIGKETGVPVVHTHFKSMGKPNFGKAKAALDLIEKARRSGIQVWADTYPWTISWGSLNMDLSWAVNLPPNNPAVEQEVRRQLAPELCTVMRAPDSQYVGRTLTDIESSMNASLIETLVRLHKMGARINCIQMSEPDIESALCRKFMAISTDGDASLSDGEHPRSYATYPRLIREYVLRRGVITLPHAIRAATGLPADIMMLNDRGYLREGKAADILLFDPKQINYCSSYITPKCYSAGIKYMLVNGVLTLDDGSYTGALAGRVLLRKKNSTLPSQ